LCTRQRIETNLVREQLVRPVRDANSSKSLNIGCNGRSATRLAASSLDGGLVRGPLAYLEGDVFVLAGRAWQERARDLK
jgi:hypothetical protein